MWKIASCPYSHTWTQIRIIASEFTASFCILSTNLQLKFPIISHGKWMRVKKHVYHIFITWCRTQNNTHCIGVIVTVFKVSHIFPKDRSFKWPLRVSNHDHIFWHTSMGTPEGLYNGSSKLRRGVCVTSLVDTICHIRHHYIETICINVFFASTPGSWKAVKWKSI